MNLLVLLLNNLCSFYGYKFSADIHDIKQIIIFTNLKTVKTISYFSCILRTQYTLTEKSNGDLVFF